MEKQLLTLLQKVRDDRDEVSRTELNDLLRSNPEARRILAKTLVDEQALISHLRDESIVSILNPERKTSTRLPTDRRSLRPLGTAVAAGLMLGMVCISMVYGYVRPRAVLTFMRITHGDFNTMPTGPVDEKFPVRFGKWSGDPAEVVEQADGNKELRFLETANINRLPNRRASSCDVFQLVDLRSLQQQSDGIESDNEIILELSAHFRRDALASDAEARKVRGVCRLYLFNAAPESIGKDWPLGLRDAVAIGAKRVKLNPGQSSVKISASCILPPEATVAVIHLAANLGNETYTPVVLGDCFADDVQLTRTSRPKLPVRIANYRTRKEF